jgi:hypothetical protein
MALGEGYVAAHRGQDARLCPDEQSHHRAEKNKCKTSQAASQATKCSDVLGRTRSIQPFQVISYVLILLGPGMPVTKSISGFFGK